MIDRSIVARVNYFSKRLQRIRDLADARAKTFGLPDRSTDRRALTALLQEFSLFAVSKISPRSRRITEDS